MKSFQVIIEEQVSKTFFVLANNEKEAADLAMEGYKNQLYVLDPGEVQHRQLCLIDEKNKQSGWYSF